MTPEDMQVRELAARWWPFALKTAHQCAKRWRVPRMYDDFECTAAEAVMVGVRAWLTKGNGRACSTFVYRTVWWRCYRLLIEERKRVSATSIDAPHGGGADGTGALNALLAGREPEPLDELLAVEGRTLGGALERLRPREREVLERHALDGELFREIAATLGVATQRAQQLHTAACQKLAALPELKRDRVPA